ncbi:NUDIX domain-containing protein [Thermodesulfobacterium sp. TA1]|uniref:NUDIX hydrolase n=1 Tax=Thermodesulfobacterium sp. TA1 TaxID=2234087 RepID=UPI00123222AB|nr:NUDIX domain-containing protein [Thermodesulfobacterium sp. TA1]QER41696.1 NUDIX domain-containing protein [Thermodesulfobacterium sp. TA1]
MNEKSKKGRKPKETPESRRRELLEAVDENCNPITILKREEIHQKSYFHKTVHIFLFNKQGEIYLQKKSKMVEENPGLWTSSASGHVLVGESFLTTAQRELKEELSIRTKLEEVLRIAPKDTNNETDCLVLFTGITNKIPKPNPLEIETGNFFSLEVVDRWVQKNPEDFTHSFKILWKLYWKVMTQKTLKGK